MLGFKFWKNRTIPIKLTSPPLRVSDIFDIFLLNSPPPHPTKKILQTKKVGPNSWLGTIIDWFFKNRVPPPCMWLQKFHGWYCKLIDTVLVLYIPVPPFPSLKTPLLLRQNLKIADNYR